MEKKKMKRPIIKRVLLGPLHLFTENTLGDDLYANKDLSLWGMILQTGNPIDPSDVLQRLQHQPTPDHPVHVGRYQPGVSNNLSNSSAWADPEVLNFGSEDLKA